MANKKTKSKQKKIIQQLKASDNMFVAMQMRPLSYRLIAALQLLVGWTILIRPDLRKQAWEMRRLFRMNKRAINKEIAKSQRERLRRFFSWSFMK